MCKAEGKQRDLMQVLSHHQQSQESYSSHYETSNKFINQPKITDYSKYLIGNKYLVDFSDYNF